MLSAVLTKKDGLMAEKAAILRSDRPGWLRVVTPYCRDFVDHLKGAIAPSHRQWDPDAKCWYVSDLYLDDLISIMNQYYKDIETDLLVARSSGTGPYAELHLLPSAPDEMVKSAYRIMSLLCHPDRTGGDDTQMKKVNAAYEEIEKERGV